MLLRSERKESSTCRDDDQIAYERRGSLKSDRRTVDRQLIEVDESRRSIGSIYQYELTAKRRDCDHCRTYAQAGGGASHRRCYIQLILPVFASSDCTRPGVVAEPAMSSLPASVSGRVSTAAVAGDVARQAIEPFEASRLKTRPSWVESRIPPFRATAKTPP